MQVKLNETDRVLSIFQDQLDELARDVRIGLISETERESAAREIRLRAQRAARMADTSVNVSRPSRALAVATVALVSVASIALYHGVGSPGLADQPLAQRRAALEQRLAEIDQAAEGNPLGREPGSFEQWWAEARR